MSRGVVGILEAFYPGPLGGRAVSDVLFGKYNPGGKMPYTTYYSTSDVPPSVNYNMSHPPGRTYRYFTKKPLIGFGYGLSFTNFHYSKLKILTSTIQPCSSLNISVSVENVGAVEGDEVILVYIQPHQKETRKVFTPNVWLVAFEWVHIHPQTIHTASFELNPYLLSEVDEDGEHYLFPGQYYVVTGGSSEDKLTKEFFIEGTVTNVEHCSSSPQCLVC